MVLQHEHTVNTAVLHLNNMSLAAFWQKIC